MEDKPVTAEPGKKPRRRWYQFGLRTLLILVTLAGCGLGWLGMKIQDGWRQKAAAAAIEKSRGTVHYDDEVNQLRGKVPGVKPAGPAWLRSLLGDDFFRSVDSVSIENRQVTDADFKNIGSFKQLKSLTITSTVVSDDGLENLRGLTQLEELKLDGTPITDAGLECLKRLTKLKSLRINDTKITDVGLQYLEGMRQLARLNLSSTNVTDAGLEHLQVLTQLQQLDLIDTWVTDAGVAKLQNALPNCLISPPGSFGSLIPF